MPLDGLSVPSRAVSLSDVVTRFDIEPVNWSILEAHKQAQLRRFGPSFWYRHQTGLGVALIASVACMAFTGGVAQSLMQPASPMPMYLSMGWMCLWAALIFAGVFRAHAGSHWEERWLPVDLLARSGVPAPVAATARMLHRDLPGSTLILGELIRESVVLDPYLLLERDGERICLGVWDDAGIVSMAR